MVDPSTHRGTIEIVEPLPEEVPAGGEIAVTARVACPHGCDLRGGLLNAVAADGLVVTGELVDDGSAEAATLVLTAPVEVGQATWTLHFPRQDFGGVLHEGCSLPVGSTVVPHATSIAVWAVPSPLVGSGFTVMVGAKCSEGCRLGGRVLEVRDETGAKVAEARLDHEPQAGTTGLFGAEVELRAPDRAGVFSRSVAFEATEPGLPHAGASADFTFRALAPPEHTVTVVLVPKDVEASLASVDVRIGPYRATTDDRGVASVGVRKGRYELSTFRTDLEPTAAQLEVTGDARVEVEVEPMHQVDEDAERAWA